MWLLLSLLPACLRTTSPETVGAPPQAWVMSADAASDYYYLVYLDSAQRGRWDLADQALGELLKIDPSPRVHYEAADLRLRANDLPGARQKLEIGLQAFPDDSLLIQRLAEVQLAEGRPLEAAASLRRHLDKHPQDTRSRLKAAQLFIDAKQYAEAVAVLEPIPAQERTSAVLFQEARARSRLQQEKHAEALLRRVLDLEPENLVAWAELAYLYELRNDLPAAEKAYSRILDHGDVGVEVWLRVIRLNLTMGRADRALEVAQAGPGDAGFVLEAARLFTAARHYDHARRLLQPLVEAPEQRPEAFLAMALVTYESEKNGDKALAWLDKAPETKSGAPRIQSLKTHLLFTLKRHDQALALAEDGQRRFPEIKDFWEVATWVHEDRNQLDKAQATLDLALQKLPEDPDLLYRSGVVREKRGDIDGAVAAMERLLSLQPDHGEAQNFLGYLLADHNRDLARAEKLVRAALAQQPESGHIVDSMAWVLFRQGRLPQAWEQILRAVKLEPKDPTVWEHYGDIALALGKKTEAAKGYRKALELGPNDPAALRRKLDRL